MPLSAKSYKINILSEENVKQNVLPYYGLENSLIEQIKFKDTAKQRAVYKVTDNSNIFCLKKVYFPLDELLFVYSAIEWLYRYHIKVPRILPTLDGNRFVEYENMLFILTPWIEGIKCNYDNPINVISSIKNLAHIHNCSKKFTPIPGSITRESSNNIFTSTKKHFNQLLNCSNLAFKYGDKFSKTFLKNFDNNLILSQKILDSANFLNISNLTRNLCHLDYVNKNIILDKDNQVWTIDFDKCRIDYKAHDISYFLRRYMRRDNTNWDIDKAIVCIEEYEKISPLNLDEHIYILMYICFPQKFWKISKDYYRNIRKCNKNSFLKILNGIIEKDSNQLPFAENLICYIENKFNTKLS